MGVGRGHAERGGRALWNLVASPEQTVPYLEEHLRTVMADAKARMVKVPQLLRDLDDEAFTIRAKARAELERLGVVAEPALRQALEKPSSAEVQKRLEELLSAVEAQRKYPSGAMLRGLRAVEVLEQVGTPDAQRVLEKWSRSAPTVLLEREARAALERLVRRSASSP